MRVHLTSSGRLEHGMRHLGEILSTAPADPGGTQPGEVVRELLEELQSDEVESGFWLATVNGRGVTSRGLEDGGGQERLLAEQFRAHASEVADDSPRSAAMMRNIASNYERDARRNDDEAEKFRRGLER